MNEILANLAAKHFNYVGEPTAEKIYEHVSVVHDYEAAHAAMDAFLVDVLRAIADGGRGKKEAAEFAQAALTINATDWPRWCS